MNEHTDFRRGRTNSPQSINDWEHLVSELNKIGPPIRNSLQWRRVWVDYKAKQKKSTETTTSLFETVDSCNKTTGTVVVIRYLMLS